MNEQTRGICKQLLRELNAVGSEKQWSAGGHRQMPNGWLSHFCNAAQIIEINHEGRFEGFSVRRYDDGFVVTITVTYNGKKYYGTVRDYNVADALKTAGIALYNKQIQWKRSNY